MSLADEYRELLTEPDCRAGYEYARRRQAIWREETAETLRSLAGVYLELYRRTENLNSLGIAAYLLDYAASRQERQED